jgi:ABC-2 type transport system permease protein
MAADPTTTTAPSAASGPGQARIDNRGAVARWELRESRRSLILWAVAIGAISAMYIAFYPSMATEDMEGLIAGLPEALQTGMGWDRIGTGAGYLESTVYALLAPALLLVFGIAAGARLLAGDEESGALELEGTGPISRRQVLLERYSALVGSLSVLVAVLAVATLILVPLFDMGVSAGNVLAAALGLLLFTLAMSTIAFAVGAATGRRAAALAVGAVVAVLAYMADTLAGMMTGGDWLQTISPFSWYIAGDPLAEGIDPVGYLALTGLVLVALVGGLAVFERRDLGV